LILVEADGARGLPLKAPGPDEPVYPSKTSVVVLVAGLGGLDRKLNEETVFRPGVFAKLSGLALGAKITAEAVARVAFHEEGPLRNAPAAARIAVFLNQADLVPPGKAGEAAMAFLAQGGKRIDRVVWGNLIRPGEGYEAMLAE
jgi:probable selenium-dependent hydroxylase accessory protein YqeC